MCGNFLHKQGQKGDDKLENLFTKYMTARKKKLLWYKAFHINKRQAKYLRKKIIHQDRITNDQSTCKNRDMQVKHWVIIFHPSD